MAQRPRAKPNTNDYLSPEGLPLTAQGNRCIELEPNIRLCLGTLWKSQEEGLLDSKTQEYSPHNQLNMAPRDSQRPKQQVGSLHGSLLGPLHISCGCLSQNFCGTSNSVNRLPDSFAGMWYMFTPMVLPHQALM